MNSRLYWCLTFIICFLLAIYGVSIAVSYGSDYGRIWNSSVVLVSDGPSYVVDTLMAPGAIYLYSFVWFIIPGFNLLVLNVLVFLATLVAVLILTNRFSKRFSSFFILLVISSSLLYAVLTDARPYLIANLLVIFGIVCFMKYVSSRKIVDLVLASILLSSAVYFQNLFLVAIAIPGLYFAFNWILSKEISFAPVMVYSCVVGAILAPWFLYRFIEAGWDFYRAPYHWMYQFGYWQQINSDLLSRPVPLSADYFSYFIDGLKLLFALPFLGLSLFFFQGRWTKEKTVIVSWLVAFCAPFALGLVPTETRYLFPLMFPLLITSVAGIGVVLNNCGLTLRRVVFAFLLVISVLSFASSTVLMIDRAATQRGLVSELEGLDSLTVDGGAVYFRSHLVAPHFKDHKVYAVTDLDIDDARNIIAWTSEPDVISSFAKYNITYVVLQRPLASERDFHSWLLLDSGLPPMHYINIVSSDCFNELGRTRGFFLYERVCYE